MAVSDKSLAHLDHDGGFHLLDAAGGHDGLRKGDGLGPHRGERVRHLPERDERTGCDDLQTSVKMARENRTAYTWVCIANP